MLTWLVFITAAAGPPYLIARKRAGIEWTPVGYSIGIVAAFALSPLHPQRNYGPYRVLRGGHAACILVERVEKPTDGRPRSCFVASNATLGDVALLPWSIEIYLKGIDIKLDSLADGYCHNGKLC